MYIGIIDGRQCSRPCGYISVVVALCNLFFGESVSPTWPILGWVAPLGGYPTTVNTPQGSLNCDNKCLILMGSTRFIVSVVKGQNKPQENILR